MARALRSEMAAAVQRLSQTGRIATGSQRKLSQIFAMVFGVTSIRVRFTTIRTTKHKRPHTEVDKSYRASEARKADQKTLQRNSCYFVAFALCVTATDCRIPETALFPEQDERAPGIQFSLHKDTLALFRSWARFQGYDANESFVGFIEQLPESPAEDEEVETEPEVATESNIATEAIVERQPAEDDFDVVARIIRDRGLSGNPTVREALRIIFPEQVYKTWPLRFGLAPLIDTNDSAE